MDEDVKHDDSRVVVMLLYYYKVMNREDGRSKFGSSAFECASREGSPCTCLLLTCILASEKSSLDCMVWA